MAEESWIDYVGELKTERAHLIKSKAGMKGAYEGHLRRAREEISILEHDLRVERRRLKEVNDRRIRAETACREKQSELMDEIGQRVVLERQRVEHFWVMALLSAALLVSWICFGVAA